MPNVKYSEQFMHGLAQVTSERVLSLIDDMLDNIEAFPDFGNANVPTSITEEFGEGVRKVAANPFDIFYTVCTEKDELVIESLISQIQVR